MAWDITMLMCSLHMSEEEGLEGLLLSANGEIPYSQTEDSWDEWGTGGQGRETAFAFSRAGQKLEP